ncbi:MAG: OmpH family outer membrane protein [Thermodesulfovibrionia bacterium]
MKRITFVVILLLIAVSSYAEETKFGFVDLNKALNECDRGKEAIKTLEDMVKEKQATIDKKGEEIKKLEEEISKQSTVLSPESLKKKQETFEKLQKEYNRMIKDYNEELQKRQNELMQAILSDLRKMIKKIGEEERYTAIFEKAEGGLLYIQDEMDITDKVIKRFNEATKQSKKK